MKEDWEAATAAYLVLKGHRFDYFFSLPAMEKLACYAAIEMERKEQLDLTKQTAIHLAEILFGDKR